MTTDSLQQRVVLVTGGGTGLGAAVTREFLRLGDRVMICQKTKVDVEAVREGLQDEENVRTIAADLSTTEGCAAPVASCIAEWGRVDILINNAAITGPAVIGSFLEFAESRLDEILAVNLRAAFLCSQYFARAVVARKGSGVIVNIGSTAALIAQPEAAAYVASKAGVLGLTRALALDLADFSIRVVMVSPGAVATDTSSETQYRSGRVTHPRRHAPLIDDRARAEDVAKGVLFVCSDAARFMTGSNLTIDGGVTAY